MREFIFLLIGGISLFLYGIHLFSNGLQKASGNSFRKLLETLSNRPFLGILLGLGVTSVLQSSSATTVMVVSFVNAGLFNLQQGISIIIGSHIGTTTTAWIVAYSSILKLSNIIFPALGLGFVLFFFTKNKKTKLIGEIIFGFGMLFLGLDFMKDAGEPLKNVENFDKIIDLFENNYLLTIAVGLFLTILVQSSSATIALVQALAWNGFINFPSSLALIIGANIGTTITAQIGALNTNSNAKRAALAHGLINTTGAVYFTVFLYIGFFDKLVNLIVPGELNQSTLLVHIAAAHTMFNVINTIIFFPFINIVAKFCTKIIKDKKDHESKSIYLNAKLLATPNIALEQVKKELIRMAKICQKSFNFVCQSIEKGHSEKTSKIILKDEETLDHLQTEITKYLVDLQQHILLEDEAEQVPCFIHSINDFEKIGDYCEEILMISIKKDDLKLKFSTETVANIKKLHAEINNLFSHIIESLYSGEKTHIKAANFAVKKINITAEEFKRNYLESELPIKLKQSKILIIVDIAFVMEKITAHLQNITETVEKDYRWTVI